MKGMIFTFCKANMMKNIPIGYDAEVLDNMKQVVPPSNIRRGRINHSPIKFMIRGTRRK